MDSKCIELNNVKELDILLRKEFTKLFDKLGVVLDSEDDQTMDFLGLRHVIRLRNPVTACIQYADNGDVEFSITTKNRGNLILRIVDNGTEIGNCYMTI